MSDTQAALTPMADHIERFWRILANEHVRILVDTRHEGNVGVVYFRSSSFPDDVAKALVADRAQLERDLADTRERSAEWAKSFARKCVEAVALASLLETVTRKVNEKIEAEQQLADAEDKWRMYLRLARESRKKWKDRATTAEAESDRLAAVLREIANGCEGRVDRDSLPCRIARASLQTGEKEG